MNVQNQAAAGAEVDRVSRASQPNRPLVWAILCERAGDNAQILALTRATGWPFEVKRLRYRRFGRLLDVWRGTTRVGILNSDSSPLTPPWPDIVISASMQNEPVCRWIRGQSAGRTRYVHIGKPWARVATFDLVITVPEYRWLPERPNILRNDCSLHEVDPPRLEEQARAWAASVAHLPKPFVALLVGGYAGPYPFDRGQAARLGREASAIVREQGGSLLVTTSARTSPAAVEALVASIKVPFTLFEWSAESGANPYLGFLGLADSIIVTCDSTSMLAEACATRKPVYLFDLAASRPGDEVQSLRVGRAGRFLWSRDCNWDRTRAFLYRNVLLRIAPNKIKRDIGRVHEVMISAGRAVWLGERFPAVRPPPLDEMPRALDRVRRLVGSEGETLVEANRSESRSR